MIKMIQIQDMSTIAPSPASKFKSFAAGHLQQNRILEAKNMTLAAKPVFYEI